MIMRVFCCALLALASACGAGETTAPVPSPTVVPAGAGDRDWASIGKACSPDAPASSVPRARLDSAPALTHGPIRSMDDDWSDYARDGPGGFAGVIISNGTPLV